MKHHALALAIAFSLLVAVALANSQQYTQKHATKRKAAPPPGPPPYPYTPTPYSSSTPTGPSWDNFDCVACETLVSVVNETLYNNETDYEELEKLEELCDYYLPIYERAKCVGVLETNGPIIIRYIQAGVNAKVICQYIAQLCGPMAVTQCDVCQVILANLEQYGTDNQTDYEVLGVVELLCNLTAEPNNCRNDVRVLGPDVISWIEESSGNLTACTEIGLCGSNDTECAVCEWAVGEIEKFGVGSENATDYAVLDVLLQGCNVLPSSYEVNQCTADLTKYGPVLIALLKADVAPEDCCQALQVCGTAPSLGGGRRRD